MSDNPKADAKAAKAYAKASRPWFKKKRFIIPLALLALIVVAQASKSGGGTSGTSPGGTSAGDSSVSAGATKDSGKSKDSGNAAPAKADVSANAAAMVKEFQDNELGADTKYKGKWVEVTGVVDKVDTEMFDSNKYVLNIGGGTDFEILTVNCHDIPKADLSSVNKGDDVTVIGEFKDGGDAGVELKHCALR